MTHVPTAAVYLSTTRPHSGSLGSDREPKLARGASSGVAGPVGQTLPFERETDAAGLAAERWQAGAQQPSPRGNVRHRDISLPSPPPSACYHLILADATEVQLSNAHPTAFADKNFCLKTLLGSSRPRLRCFIVRHSSSASLPATATAKGKSGSIRKTRPEVAQLMISSTGLPLASLPLVEPQRAARHTRNPPSAGSRAGLWAYSRRTGCCRLRFTVSTFRWLTTPRRP